MFSYNCINYFMIKNYFITKGKYMFFYNFSNHLWFFFLKMTYHPLRYVSWNAYVMRNDGNVASKESNAMVVLNAPHWNYYIQEGVDMGIVMETDIPVSVVSITLKNPIIVELAHTKLSSISCPFDNKTQVMITRLK